MNRTSNQTPQTILYQSINNSMSIYYIDLDVNLKKDITGDITKVYNFDAIKQSIRAILSTSPGERINNPEFGSKLRDLLSDPIDEITADEISVQVQDTITRWENRVIVRSSVVIPNEDNNTYDVFLDLEVIEIGEAVTFEGKLRTFT